MRAPVLSHVRVDPFAAADGCHPPRPEDSGALSSRRSETVPLRWLIGIVALVALAAGPVLAAWAVKVAHGSEDVVGVSTVEFVTTDAPAPKPPPPAKPTRRAPGPLALGVAWPTFGYSNERVRIAPYRHRPPFREAWRFRARELLEFPPAVAFGRLYFSNNSGTTFAIDATTGAARWRKAMRRCTASSPAVAGRTVYQSFMNRPPCNAKEDPEELDGEVVAFDALSGRIRWRTTIGPTESSPLVVGRRLIVGDWRANVYALDLGTGRILWTFRAGGRVKGAAAGNGGRVFVGAYDGRLYALDVRSGRLLWTAESQERFGGRGTFYSTPAVAYGRVFIGSTDGKVYAYGATSGTLLWSQSTGGYVYSSPAVWNGLVFAGSYSERLFALDAGTGEVVWSRAVGGPVSGAPTVMAGLVYAATLRDRTLAFDARTGRPAWTFPDGKYTPIVADRDRTYLVGHTRVYGLVERR